MTGKGTTTMAPPKTKDDKGDPEDLVSVKIKRKNHRKLRRLAAATDMDISAYLDRLVEKHFAEAWPKLRDEP